MGGLESDLTRSLDDAIDEQEELPFYIPNIPKYSCNYLS
jgi:hypothetical protein